MRFILATVLPVLGAPVATAAPLVPFFHVIGDLPGGADFSQVFRVSPDGSTAVGRSASDAGFEAVRWTEAEGLVPIGDLAGGDVDAFATGASADGSVIVGLGASDSGREAFRWTAAGGMVGLGDLPGGGFASDAYDVTADGSMVVGRGRTEAGLEAWYWTQATGLVSIGDLPGGPVHAIARGVSADGAVIVGDSLVAPDVRQAYRWTQATGMVPLPVEPGATEQRAWDVSPDGAVIVGDILLGSVGSDRLGWRWTEADGFSPLADLPGGGVGAVPRAVSADGTVVMGSGSTTLNNAGARATYWLENGVPHQVGDLLEAWGLDLGGVVLTSVLGVSDDGLVFGGNAFGADPFAGTVAWVAGVPSLEPPVPEPSASTLLGVGLAVLTIAGCASRARRA